MKDMKNMKTKVCSAIIAIGYVVALWSKNGSLSTIVDHPVEYFLPMIIIFFGILAVRKFLSKKEL